jgi:hypothetical protein
VRTKIILSFLIVIVFGGLLFLSFGSRLVKNTVISQAQAKVKFVDFLMGRLSFREFEIKKSYGRVR